LAAVLAGVFLVCVAQAGASDHHANGAVSQAVPSFSAMNDECALGPWGSLLVKTVLPREDGLLPQEAERELSALLEESRRRIWDLLNEVQTEQWKLGELARSIDAPSQSLRKQYLRVQLLCAFTVDTALNSRDRIRAILDHSSLAEEIK
jgi:hypothetical protein